MIVDNAYALPWVAPWSAATQCMGRVKRRSVQQLRFTHQRTRVRNPRLGNLEVRFESTMIETRRWGPERELNPRQRNHNPLCCHYTTRAMGCSHRGNEIMQNGFVLLAYSWRFQPFCISLYSSTQHSELKREKMKDD